MYIETITMKKQYIVSYFAIHNVLKLLAVPKRFIKPNLIITPETVHKALASKAFYGDNISVRYNSGGNLNLKIYFHKVKSVTFQSPLPFISSLNIFINVSESHIIPHLCAGHSVSCCGRC